MKKLVDLGKASKTTAGLVPSVVQLEAGRIVENGLRYRAKPAGPMEPKVRESD
jgi:hypothetical protein